MMDKKPHIKPYLYGMFAGFGAISLSILFFFLIYRFQGFGNAVSTLTGILMPFIYGSVIAYLLKPVCNWIEAFLHKLFPERMHRFANMLAVALTILFGLLLIYALIMMIVPQLINSVTALYFTARDNIGDFVEWISKQEFIANNKKLLDFIENSYDSLDANLDAWIKNTLLPSMQNILSGAAVGVVNVVYVLSPFGRPQQPEKVLRVTVPEDLEFDGMFDAVLARYTAEHELTEVSTTNMGSLYQLEYRVRLAQPGIEKRLMDEVRCLNGNLKVSLSSAQISKEVL